MKLSEYLTEGLFDKRRASMKADLEKKYGSPGAKTIDLIYKHLMMVPDFKKLSMDRGNSYINYSWYCRFCCEHVR